MQINDRSLATLSGLTALEKLDIGETAVKGWGLTHLKRLGRLQELTLANCMKLQDEWVGHVRELTSLQKIALDGCTQLTDAGVAGLVE